MSDRSSQEDPTHAEVIRRVADAYNSTCLTHFGKGLFQKCLAVLH